MEAKFKVVIPDLTFGEAVEMVETAGGGEVRFSKSNGKGYDPHGRQPLGGKLFAYPRQNVATISPQLKEM